MKKAFTFLAAFCLGFAAYGQCVISDIVALPFRATAAVVNGLVTPYNANQTVVVTQPTYSQPVVVQPTYTQPVVVQPTYAQPVVQQVVTQPVYTTTSTVVISQPAPVVTPIYRGWGYYGGWGWGGCYRPCWGGWGGWHHPYWW